MDHVAIMNPRLGLIEKILTGEKTIESRWQKNRSVPWLKIFEGDVIYFKNSGNPVTARAEVERVEYIDELNENRSKEIIKKYGRKICLMTPPPGKKYCVLMWLKNPKRIEPFRINKKGFGSAAAWLCVDNIEKIKIRGSR